MTKYRLKDRDLQAELDRISNGDFTKKLETEAQIDIPPFDSRGVVRVYFGDFGDTLVNRYSAIFERDELEEAIEFDPTKWNSFPEITPPLEEDMRVEVGEGHGYMAWWDGQNWRTRNHCYSTAKILEGVKRFRPWEDK